MGWQPMVCTGHWDNNGVSGTINAIGISGSNIYVGGSFSVWTTAGRANYVARWDGSQWFVLGSADNNGTGGSVNAIATSGTDVYVGGWFAGAGGVSANRVARWNGSQWSALGNGSSGTYAPVYALATNGSSVYVGGEFGGLGGVIANKIARWDAASGQWFPLGSGVNNG